MPRRQAKASQRKRGHSQTEAGNPAEEEGKSSPSLDQTASHTSTKVAPVPRPVKRTRARTIIDDDTAENPAGPDQEQPAPQPEDTRRYHTRNPGRRPGKHVGLDWQEDQRQQQAEADARAEKRKEKKLQQEARDRDAQHHARGLKHIAELEAARELEERADEDALEARTAHGYHLAANLASSARVCDTGILEDSGSEFQDNHEEEVEEVDDEEVEDDSATQKQVSRPKGKAVQRRITKRIQTRHLIDSARPAQPAQSTQPASNSTVIHPGDAFNNDYRQNLLERSQGRTAPTLSRVDTLVGRVSVTAHKKQRDSRLHPGNDVPSPQTLSTPTRPAHRTPATLDVIGLRIRNSPSTPTPASTRALTLRAASCLESEHSDHNGEGDGGDFQGGLREDDEGSMRTHLTERPRGHPRKTLALVTVQPKPTSKPKGPPRRTADAMPASKSLSALNLPDDLYSLYEEQLIPTCIDIFGGFKDPWIIKPAVPKDSKTSKPPSLLEVITLLVNEFHAHDHDHSFEESDLIFKVTRQRLINWRNGFLGRACTVVKEGEKAFSARVKMATGRKTTPTDVKAWAEVALKSNGGEAWYEEPVSADNEKPRGMFMSVYMLRTFAPHLAAMSKSCLEESNPQMGALAMAAAAVEAAFKCYTDTGTYQAPEGDFDKVGGGGLTEKWLRGGVTNLYNKRNRWDETMDAALEMAAETRVGRKHGRNVKIVDPYERDVVPHSSSPPRPA